MGVNTLYAGLVMHPGSKDVDWSRLRLAGGGGAAVIGTVSDKWQALTGSFIREGYGLSETSPVVSFNPAQVKAFTGTTGLPLPSTDVKLLDDEGREVGVGESGEICVKGPQVMRGYWNQPEANAAAFTADGYFRTGDIGSFDAQGFLKIVDRKKDMIIVSGFNVYPNEIEAVVTGCPGVAECACVGAPDEKSGEAVKLFVVNARLSADRGRCHCLLPPAVDRLQGAQVRAPGRCAAQVDGGQDPAPRTARRGLKTRSPIMVEKKIPATVDKAYAADRPEVARSPLPGAGGAHGELQDQEITWRGGVDETPGQA
jgi:acyl-CoA synthetase (AMP-forming)/AMP-acid ligase II